MIILTGTRGKGKTRACQKWVEQARLEGHKVSGLVCPAVFINDLKTGIDVQNLETGECRHLATLADGNASEVATDRWKFDPQVLQWGSRILKGIGKCDILVIDELGPLEFYRKLGWVEAMDILTNGDYNLSIVVIRPELVDEARTLWPGSTVYSLDKP
jgi:nucleoside-triphosphatase